MKYSSEDFLFNGKLKAIERVGSVRKVRVLGYFVFFFIILAIPSVLFLPWLQTTSGSGKVIVFEPLLRRSEVQAPLSGRISKLNVLEGQKVKKGQVLATIEDNDPKIEERIKTQVSLLQNHLKAALERRQNLEEKLNQKELYLKESLIVEQQKIASVKAYLEFQEQDFKRHETLFKDGLVSQVKLQKSQAELLKARNKKAEAEASLNKVKNNIQAEIADSRASINKALADIAKVSKEVTALETKQAKVNRLQVLAPSDGTVRSISVNDGVYLKPGSPICSIIPETDERFVEIHVDGNYISLLNQRKMTEDGKIKRHGNMVRIQFEGWPAVQVAGWPGVAVGTFSGEVIFIDSQDDGTGHFRVIIAPVHNADQSQDKTAVWPSTEFLRLGIRVKAWVEIQEVQIWEELWRRLNGFPPVMPDKQLQLKQSGKAVGGKK